MKGSEEGGNRKSKNTIIDPVTSQTENAVLSLEGKMETEHSSDSSDSSSSSSEEEDDISAFEKAKLRIRVCVLVVEEHVCSMISLHRSVE